MYTSAKSAAEPMGFSPVAVPADHHGMRVEALEIILSNWNEKARGMRRCFFSYRDYHGHSSH
jgi:DNA-binding transcriptional MocR family regulator